MSSLILIIGKIFFGLNPYYNGKYSMSAQLNVILAGATIVLILIIMENTL